MTLGDIIAQYRSEQNLSQRQFALRCGLSNGYIGMIERNVNPSTGKPIEVSLFNIKMIARAMGITADQLIRMVDGTTPVLLDGVPLNDPNYDAAATAATELLIRSKISAPPVMPLTILKNMRNVLVVSFTETAGHEGPDISARMHYYGAEPQDVRAFSYGSGRTVVSYNQRMPYYMIQESLARELGHIILKHDRQETTETQVLEALCFSRHLLCPRPLVFAMRDAGIRTGIETIGNITGCYGRYIAGMRNTPGARVPPELNRLLKSMFSDYISTIKSFDFPVTEDDDSPLADFGTYMEGYEE